MRFVLLLLALLAMPAARGQTVWFVDADATGSASGTSWADGFSDLQLALAAATSGDEVWVAEGLYRPTSGGDRSISFVLSSGVALYGGFDGTETSRDERDWTLHETILSGDVGVPGDSTDNTYNVLTAIGTNSGTVLDGFTVQHGKASVAMAPYDRGAGLYAPMSDIVVRNCLFRWNVASVGGGAQRGGGIYFESGAPLVEDSAFIQNIGGGGIYDTAGMPTLRRLEFRANRTHQLFFEDGSAGLVEDVVIEDGPRGGVFVYASSPRFIRTTIRNNRIPSGGHGGGIRIEEGAAPLFEDCLFENNFTVGGDGGAAYLLFASATFLRATFRANQANGGSGGAIQARTAPVVCLGCLFDRNRSVGSGGALSSDGTLTVINTHFVGNEGTLPTAGGGALVLAGSPPAGETQLIANTVFAGNSAGSGGAVFLASPQSARLVNVTMTGNRARNAGGAIIAQNAQGVRIENAVLWGNEALESPEVSVFENGYPVIAQSIVAGGYPSGAMILDEDPLFVRAPDPGPDNQWGTPDDDYGDLRLQEGSPAVDYGLADYLPPDTWDLDDDGDTKEPLPVDLTGGPRQIGASPDLGAYEGAVRVANEPGVVDPTGQLALWPNPASGAFRIRFEPHAEAVVTDVLGREVRRVALGADGVAEVATAGLAAGVYVVRMGRRSAVLTVRR